MIPIPASFPSKLITREYQSPAVSEEVRKLLRQTDQHFEQTASASKDELYQSINEIRSECLAANWNGEGAKAVSKDAVEEALLFARGLASFLPIPHVAPTATGAIAFEWRGRGRRALIATVAGRREIDFAISIDRSLRLNGSFAFADSVPPQVEEWLNEYFRA